MYELSFSCWNITDQETPEEVHNWHDVIIRHQAPQPELKISPVARTGLLQGPCVRRT